MCTVGTAVVHPDDGLVCGLSIAILKARCGPTVEREHAALLQVAAARLVVMLH